MAVSNLVGKGAKKSVRIRKWLRITALFMAVWVVCAAAVAEGAALPEESASVQAEASDGQPAQVPQEGAPPLRWKRIPPSAVAAFCPKKRMKTPFG